MHALLLRCLDKPKAKYIDEVAQRWIRLELEWVTVFGRAYNPGI